MENKRGIVRVNKFHWSTPVNKALAYIHYNEGIEPNYDLKKQVGIFYRESGQFTEKELKKAKANVKRLYKTRKASTVPPKEYAIDLFNRLRMNQKLELKKEVNND